jgi:hypothetical protein
MRPIQGGWRNSGNFTTYIRSKFLPVALPGVACPESKPFVDRTKAADVLQEALDAFILRHKDDYF